MDLLMTLASAAEVESNKKGVNVDEINDDNDSGRGCTTATATAAAPAATKPKKTTTTNTKKKKMTSNCRHLARPTKKDSNNNKAKGSTSFAASTTRPKNEGRPGCSGSTLSESQRPDEPPPPPTPDVNHTDDPILAAAAAAALAWAKQSKTTTTATTTTTKGKGGSKTNNGTVKATVTGKASLEKGRQFTSMVQQSQPIINNNNKQKKKKKRVIPLVVEQQQGTKKRRTSRTTNGSTATSSNGNDRKQEPIMAAAKATTARSETEDDDDDDDDASFSDDSVYGAIKTKATPSTTPTLAVPSTNTKATTIMLEQEEDDDEEEESADSTHPQAQPHAHGAIFQQHSEIMAIQQHLLAATAAATAATASNDDDDDGDDDKIATNLSEDEIRHEDVVFPGRHGSQLPKDKVYTGYVWYKNFLEQQRDLYLQCFTKAQRTALSREIVLIVHKRGGRFFEKNLATGRYNGMTDTNAIMRTSKKMKDSMDPLEERNRFLRRNHGSLAAAAAALAPAGGVPSSSGHYRAAAGTLTSSSAAAAAAAAATSSAGSLTSPRMDFKTMTKELSHQAHQRNLESELAKRQHEHEQTLMMQRMALNREMELARSRGMEYGRVRDVTCFGRRDPMGGYGPDMAMMMQAGRVGGFSSDAGPSTFLSPTMYGGIHPYASQMPSLALHSGSSSDFEALKRQAAGVVKKTPNNEDEKESDGSAKARGDNTKQEGVSKDGYAEPEKHDEPTKVKTIDGTGTMDTSLSSVTSGPDTLEISQRAKKLWQSLAAVSWVRNDLEPETRPGPAKTTNIKAEEFGAVDIVYTGRGGHHEYYTTPTSCGSVRKEDRNEEPPPYHRAYFWYKSLIEDKRLEYMTCQNKIHKMKISRSIVEHVRKKGGRFLEKSPDGTYIDVGDSKAQVKTSMFLRDKRSWEELLRKLTKIDPPAAQEAQTLSGAPPNALQCEITQGGSLVANVKILARTTAAAEPNGQSLLGPFGGHPPVFDDRHLQIQQNLQQERMLRMAVNGGFGFGASGIMIPPSLAGAGGFMGMGMGGIVPPSMIPPSSMIMEGGGAGGGGAAAATNSLFMARLQVQQEQAMRQRMEREQMMMMMNRFR